MDSWGKEVVRYRYDAWGNLLETSGDMADTLGKLNVLRYRGYCYDDETGLYYLKARYYNPAWGRFISSDSYASTGQGQLSSNMFTYCLNNPVNKADPSGTDAIVLFDSDSVGHIGALIQDKDGKWWHFYWGAKPGLPRVSCVLGFDVTALTWCIPYTDEPSLEEINQGRQFSGNYEEMLYLRGDFSNSLSMAQNTTGNYNLYSANCSQVTLSVLSKSETAYKDSLLKASNKTLPKNAFKVMENEFTMNAKNQSASTFYGINNRNLLMIQ